MTKQGANITSHNTRITGLSGRQSTSHGDKFFSPPRNIPAFMWHN